MRLDQVKTQVLLLHSEQSTLDNLSSGFTDHYTVHCATSGTEALTTLTETPIHVIISAQDLPGMSGVDALREAKKRSPETIGILLAGHEDDGLEALVGDMEVFQIVRGGISADDVSKLVDNATQQMRLLALAESANDTAAHPDEPVSEHIVMETSENGSAIISDGTGTVPILDPQKVSVAASAGSRTVDILVLTKDDEFLATVKESSRGMHNIRYTNTLAQAEEALAKHHIGVAVVDAAMVGANVEKLTEHLRGKTSRLVSIVAGRRDDGEMLMDLINRGKVYRFLLKPVSPGRARLAVEASVKHHLEAPDAAFKNKGKAPAAKPVPKAKAAPKPAPVRKAKATPKPAPAPKVRTAPKPAPAPKAKATPKPAPKPKAARASKSKAKPTPVEAKIKITPSFENDRLGTAFDGDDSSFAETMTGIVANIGEKLSSRKEKKAAKSAQAKAATPAPVKTATPAPARVVTPAAAPIASTDGTDGSPFSKTGLMGIGAAAIIAAVAIGIWMFSGSDDTAPGNETVASQNEVTEAEPVGESLAVSAAQPGIAAQEAVANEEIDLALATAEAAMLDRRIGDAAAALDSVANADPDNARLPFLMAQLSQMQSREYVDNARTAIRETRLEDAANALDSARALDVADTSEINAIADELAAARSEQRVSDVLAQAVDRLEQGKLLSPANDNAGYFYELVLSSDPNNTAAQQGLTIIASKLVLQARTEIDGNRFDRAERLLGDARRLDPSSDELTAASRALTDAQSRVAEESRRVEAARLAAIQKAEDDRLAAVAAQRAENARLAAVAATAATAAAKKLEDERIAAAAAKKLGDERIAAAAAKKLEDERIAAAAAKKLEDDRITAAATKKLEDDRIAAAAAKKLEDDRITAAAAKKLEDDRIAAAAAAAAAVPELPPAQIAVAETVGPERLPVQQETVGVSSLTRIKYVAPKYPRSAERRSLSGWVDVVFTVATDGTTKDVGARNSEPGEMFVNAATKAVEKWEFMPVFENGMVVEKRAGVRMMFAIE